MLANLGRQCRTQVLRNVAAKRPIAARSNKDSLFKQTKVPKLIAKRWLSTESTRPAASSSTVTPTPSVGKSSSASLKDCCSKGDLANAQKYLAQIVKDKALEPAHTAQILELCISRRHWRTASEICEIMLQHRMWPHPKMLVDLTRLLAKNDLDRAHAVLKSYPNKDDSVFHIATARLLQLEGNFSDLIALSKRIDDSRLDVKQAVISAIIDIHTRKSNPLPRLSTPKSAQEAVATQQELLEMSLALEQEAVDHALSEMRRLHIRPTLTMYERAIKHVGSWEEATEIFNNVTQDMGLPIRPTLVNRLIQRSGGNIELAFMLFGVIRLNQLQESWKAYSSLIEVVRQHKNIEKRVQMSLIILHEQAKQIDEQVIQATVPNVLLLPLRRTVSQVAKLVKTIHPDYNDAQLDHYARSSSESNIGMREAQDFVTAVRAWTNHVFGSSDSISQKFNDMLMLDKVHQSLIGSVLRPENATPAHKL